MKNISTSGNSSINGFPLFLLGSARSGTTLLQKVLNSAEDVMIWGEHGGFLKQIAEAYFFNLNNEEIDLQIFRQNPVAKDPSFDFHNQKMEKIGYCWINWYGKKEIEANFGKFIESFFNPHSLGKACWGFKEIRYGFDDSVMEMLAAIYPQARFVFIVRDPIDVLASQVAMGWYGGWKYLAEKWAIQNRHIIEFCNANEDRVFTVKYEDLVSRESDIIRKLFDWLGFTISEETYGILDIKEGIWKKTRGDDMPHRAMFSKRKLRKILKIIQVKNDSFWY